MFGRKTKAHIDSLKCQNNNLNEEVDSLTYSLANQREGFEAEIRHQRAENERLRCDAKFLSQANKALMADKSGLLERMQGASALLNGRDWKPEEATAKKEEPKSVGVAVFCSRVEELRGVYRNLFSKSFPAVSGSDLLKQQNTGLCNYVPGHLRQPQKVLFRSAGLHPLFPFGDHEYKASSGVKPSLGGNRGRLLWVSFIASGGRACNFKKYCLLAGYDGLDFNGAEKWAEKRRRFGA